MQREAEQIDGEEVRSAAETWQKCVRQFHTDPILHAAHPIFGTGGSV